MTSKTRNSFSSSFINKNEMNILLINARSLRPKLYSLINTLHEIDGHIALVNETWFRPSNELERMLEDRQNVLGYLCIRKDRSNGMGGGVAIIYKHSEIKMQQLKIDSDYEIVAALGRRTGQRRKLIVISAYIPPNYDAENHEAVLEKIANLVGSFKRKYNSPYIVVGGDFNGRNIVKELRPYPDMKLQKTPPTRGNKTLDLVLTNF